MINYYLLHYIFCRRESGGNDMRPIALVLLVCSAILILSGCGGYGPAGPVNVGNIIHDYPPKIRSVAVNTQASMVVVDFQPFDADVTIEGWVFVPTTGGQSRRSLNFVNDTINGESNLTGRANFVMDGSFPIDPQRPMYFMITVKERYFDGDRPRTAVKTFKVENGIVTVIS